MAFKISKLFYWFFWLALALSLLNLAPLGYAFLLFSLWGIFFMAALFGERLKQKTNVLGTMLSQKSDTSEALFSLLKKYSHLSFVFQRALLDQKSLMKALKVRKGTTSENLKETEEKALAAAKERNHEKPTPGDLLVALAETNDVFKTFLVQNQLQARDIQNLVSWLEYLEQEIQEPKKFWLQKNLRKRGTLAKNWTAGYTATLDSFSTDLSELVKRSGFPKAVGHQKEREAMERILARDHINNVLLVGEPGAGSKSLVHDLASRSMLGETLGELAYKRVLQLDLSSLLARVPDIGQREQVLDLVFSEVMHAGNVILVIDELHNFVGSNNNNEPRPGAIDITGVLAPYLQSPEFPIVALTTFAGLRRGIEPNSSLLSLFEKVEVAEISEEQALLVLEQKALGFEQKYKKFISYPGLKAVLSLSQKYIQAVPLPKKALDLLDEAMVYLDQTKEKVLLPSHVAKIVEQKTEIPVGEVETKERETLLNLEDLIHKRVIDQEEAVQEISSALRRARAAISSRKGPIGGFLFLGPTGVGKTETAKALATVYFGAESRMIRLDMSEFQNLQDIGRLLGSQEQDGLLTTQIRENPFSLLLLDEIEKAHPNILNLFLQVLDEGHITDGLGRTISFQHAIIIATSNAGAQLIVKAIQQNTAWEILKEQMREHLLKEGLFRPEFLNRFDGIMLFKPLSKEHLLSIAHLMLGKLQRGLKEKGIEFIITQDLKEALVRLGYDPIFGARPMKRVIQDRVENVFATAFLKKELKPEDKVELTKDFQLQHV